VSVVQFCLLLVFTIPSSQTDRLGSCSLSWAVELIKMNGPLNDYVRSLEAGGERSTKHRDLSTEGRLCLEPSRNDWRRNVFQLSNWPSKNDKYRLLV